MKKSLLWLLIVLVVVSVTATFLLAGCRTEVTPPAVEEISEEEVIEEVPTEEATVEAEKPFEGLTLKVLHTSGPEADLLNTQIPDFEAKTGMKVQMDLVTRDDIPVRLLRELIEGAGSYDLVLPIAGNDYATYVYKGNYISIEDYLTPEEVEQFYARANFTDPRTGKMSGIPQFQNWQMAFYRSDLFNDPDEQAAFKEEYGRDLTVPTNYDELYEVASFFHRPPDLYGYMIGGIDWSFACDFEYALFAHGGNYGDEDGNLTLNTPEAIKAAESMAKLAQLGPPGWETQSFFDADALMLDGKLFMYTNWFYIWSTLQQEMGDKVAMVAPIGGGAALSGWLGLIPENSPNPDAAAEFLKWMGSFDVQKEHVLALGNLPSRNDVLQDPEIQAINGMDEFEKASAQTLIGLNTWMAESSQGIHEAMFMIINGEKTAEEAMDWVQNVKFAGRKSIE